MVCGGLRWFACFPLFSLPIVPNSGGDLWLFAVICGGLGWFAMVCGGLTYSHTDIKLNVKLITLYLYYLQIRPINVHTYKGIHQ